MSTDIIQEQVNGFSNNLSNSINQSKYADGRTLYVGHLSPYVAEYNLQELFSILQPENIKIIKDKQTGVSAGYGFVQFQNENQASSALQQYNSKPFMGQEIKMNWAFTSSQQKEESQAHYQIFVGDLSQEVTDVILKEHFSSLGKLTDARVMMDYYTGRSKGYGFVSYKVKDEAQNAINIMNEQMICNRKIRCSWASHKQDSEYPTDLETIDRQDPTNTNIYVGNIAPETTESELKRQFAVFGQVAEIKMHKKGGYAFLRYQKHQDAVQAIFEMHGKQSSLQNTKILKCAWGKNSQVMPMASMYGMAQGMNQGVINSSLMSPNLMQGQAAMMLPQAMSNLGLNNYMQYSQNQNPNLQHNIGAGQGGLSGLPQMQNMDPQLQYYNMYAYSK